MEFKLIGDSCCDTTKELKEKLKLTTVPLTMRLGDKEFVDDDNLDLQDFQNKMKAYKGKVASAAPSPYSYTEAIEKTGNCFIITLSKKLSGSYNNAVLAQKAAQESGINAYTVDSKSASAGETLVALKLRELIDLGLPQKAIIEEIELFADKINTFFVLDNYDNLQKNGRMSRIIGKIIQFLNIKLIMGSDGDGNIKLFDRVGAGKMVSKLMELIADSCPNQSDKNIVISHCNNLPLAQTLAQEITAKFDFKGIYIVPTGGLSTLYADERGIILAF